MSPSNTLEDWAAKGYSQLGADGIIHKLFSDLDTTNKVYVEFGTQSGSECNSRRLREVCGWTGLLMDGSHENAAINLKKEWIMRENIVTLFHRYHVPHEPDLLSVDIDGNDFHVLSEILRTFRPRVVVVETNFGLNRFTDMTRAYDNKSTWDGTCYSSASTLAFTRLARHYHYSVVGAMPPDLFWVRDDVLAAKEHVWYSNTNDVSKLIAQAYASWNLIATQLGWHRSEGCAALFRKRGFQTSAEVISRTPGGAEAPVHYHH